MESDKAMTNEELDEARAKEARRLWLAQPDSREVTLATIAARIVRESWTPVDPDLLLAREVVAKEWADDGCHGTSELVLAGTYDVVSVKTAAAIKAADARRGE